MEIKKEVRTEILKARVTPQEYERAKLNAKKARRELSDFIRLVVLQD